MAGRVLEASSAFRELQNWTPKVLLLLLLMELGSRSAGLWCLFRFMWSILVVFGNERLLHYYLLHHCGRRATRSLTKTPYILPLLEQDWFAWKALL